MTTKNKKGFTIIEVVLVLAIAGLIFLMVFIALPALQRSQRNTQRENDLSRFLTAANDFQTNNSGKTPWKSGDTDPNFVARYIDDSCSGSGTTFDCKGDQFRDPDGTLYSFVYKGELSANTTTALSADEQKFTHNIYVWTNAGCGDENALNKGTGIRQYAMMFVLEGGAITCNDNH